MTTDASADLKSTVNLPETSFQQKGNLVQSEPQRLEKWNKMKLYEKLRKLRRGRPIYNLHDGPPYANGKIHMGTALNKILKDFVLKSRAMMGFDTPYIPGYDCHGLPIEHKVDSELGAKKRELSTLEFRRRCREFAEKYIVEMNRDFARLGVLGEWDAVYKTMSTDYEADTLRALGQFIRRGSVYRGLKPVHWCINCQTALAEAEVEYSRHISPSIYVKFPLKSDASLIDPVLANKKVAVLIWTTTPWTLPANLGVSFNAGFNYSAVAIDDEVYIVASGLVSTVANKLGWKTTEVIAEFKGERLNGLSARHPFYDRESLFMLGDHVTLDAGTGCVHTAPGHGHDDFVIGKTHGLEVYCPVDNRGRFKEDVSLFAGQNVFEANRQIVEHLRELDRLLLAEEYEHDYPHCWRCHKPVIFRATPQWFISMDKTDLRGRALAAIEKIQWRPAWGRERMHNMFVNRIDWCISRQRAWGVPITVFYCEDCGSELISADLIDHIADIFEREGADAWYARPVEELVPKGTCCKNCSSTRLRKEMDILDVWLDSGVSWTAVRRRGYDIPVDLYFEGSDQYRGWFNSSLVCGLEMNESSPYRICITHGYVVDKDGRKMSKSLGNVIEPEKVLKQHGADILRLWAASIDYTEDIRISDEILKRLSDSYRKIRNTAKYALGNLADFDPDKDSVAIEQMLEIDRWALAVTNELLRKVRAAYEAYEFHTAYREILSYCSVELSALYFDILKDRLYTSAPKSLERRSAQTVIYRIVKTLALLVAPILAFTADEIWEHLPDSSELESVHLAEFPEYEEDLAEPELLARWERIFAIRSAAKKAMEEAGFGGGSSLKACVEIRASGKDLELLRSYEQQLHDIFIASYAVVVADETAGQPVFRVTHAPGTKCERCWHYTEDVGYDPDFPQVCLRCAKNIRIGWLNA
ncbi:MAG: isoleucine--tRNA ligase [Acidobacteriota bacterium]|nr:isoleucine--tRNA ligase [Blastocatellia bacterium]MDW8412862.1 isoleucine--tRNA ligase [Acidobacteriota bacterium]